ncbi:SDR family NAD(P)-dependent oxidoreductase [Algimonas porphyrae]|uniref:3-oxoacyl-ACP reductase n=1 Tax=Algimonas porphyrae TaxID=1128113 RepID=A0ABQ5V491_9PROT|nr:SDR family NAD(P)-dependent oxidoreductase [Algimonas porphyrae]GLQ21812.1 3-oxoacyl-ACP reductase [Algimonas porphyrae]
MAITFDNRVAIITGAGGGLGRSHALALAARGVKIVVNDLGGAVDGTGGSETMAQKVVTEIESMGGEAIANGANVTKQDEVEAMVAEAIERFGKVDILVNNAGILRDRSFSKMTLEDWKLVVDVHLHGSATCTKAVWNHMKENKFGRIVMTTSSSGMYGNFGQTNYGAAKAGLSGFMRTLCLEGAKYDIRVNTLSPTARSRMTEGLMPEEILEKLKVEPVSQGLVYLACDDAPNRVILAAGAGGYALTKVFETKGVNFAEEDATAENVAAHWDAIASNEGMEEFTNGGQQGAKFLTRIANGEFVK